MDTKELGNQSDKSLSCSSTEVVYELSPYDQEQFSTVLHDIEPAGWTPLAASIAATYEDLQAAEGMENIIYIVSDGVETCDGDPAEEAKKLNSSNIKAVVNIIGFDVDNAGQNELMAVAEAGKGKYMTVTSQQELEEFFTSEQRELEKEWLQWQAENVSNYYKTELEKRKQVHAIKNAIYEKANEEMEKLLALTDFMQTELDLDADSKRKIDKAIRNRNNDIRTYAREKENQYIREIQEQARESREDVRKKGEEEREKMNED
nr:VWA domain-containing protein [Paenibacillus bovis]